MGSEKCKEIQQKEIYKYRRLLPHKSTKQEGPA
jgi:hypothetical protein